MSLDLTAPAARAERDSLAARTEVLDKVKVLSLLPDDIHLTIDMTATYYEVPIDSIEWHIRNNRDELESDGMVLIAGQRLSEFKAESGYRSRAASLTLLTRRAALRLGMLLRDSEVARRVRTHLLDVEQDARSAAAPDPSTPLGILAMAEQFASTARQLVLESEARQQLEAAVERQAPLVAKAEAHSVSDGAAVNRQTYAREVQAWGKKQGVTILHEQVYEILRRKGMLIAGDRSDRNHASSQAVKSGWAWTKKDVTEDGHATATTYLRPRGQDLAWKWITQHVNEFGDLRPQAVSA